MAKYLKWINLKPKVMLNHKTLASQSFDFFLSLGCKHPAYTYTLLKPHYTAWDYAPPTAIWCACVHVCVHACLRKNNDFWQNVPYNMLEACVKSLIIVGSKWSMWPCWSWMMVSASSGSQHIVLTAMCEISSVCPPHVRVSCLHICPCLPWLCC